MSGSGLKKKRAPDTSACSALYENYLKNVVDKKLAKCLEKLYNCPTQITIALY